MFSYFLPAARSPFLVDLKMFESKEWSSQWIFQFKQLERRSLKKKIRASTGFEPMTSARWSFFAFIYNRSSNMNYFIYFTSLKMFIAQCPYMAGSRAILSVVGTDIFLICSPAVIWLYFRIEFICTSGTGSFNDISIWAKAPEPAKRGGEGRLFKGGGDFAPKDTLCN